MTLPWDQITPERRTIGDSTSRLEDHNGVLGVALAQWMARDETRPQPAIRQAANTAMDAIDSMLAELHQLRARLVSEIRQADDATAARVDALLARPLRPYCLPGCDRLDGHDGRDPGACMQGGEEER